MAVRFIHSWVVAWLCLVLTGVAIAGVPDIQVAGAVLDMGEVLEGEPAIGSFTVANRGDEPLVIKKVGRSAGGHVEAFTGTIAPGTSGKIDVRLSTSNKQGKIEGGFFVYSNDPDQSRLFIKAYAQVTPLIAVTPDRAYFNGFADQTHRTTITLESNLGRPLRIKSLACSIEDLLDYRLKNTIPGKTWLLEVAPKQPSPGTYFRGRFTFETDCIDKPTIVVPVLARILDDVEVMPAAVDFGIRMKKDYVKPLSEDTVNSLDWKQSWHKLPRQIILRVNRGEDVQIKDVGLDDPLFQVEHKALQEGRLYRLIVTPRIDQMGMGRHKTLLRIITDNSAHERFGIPIEITIK